MLQLAARRRGESKGNTESHTTSEAEGEKGAAQQRWKWQPPDARRVSEGSAEPVTWKVAKGLSDRGPEVILNEGTHRCFIRSRV